MMGLLPSCFVTGAKGHQREKRLKDYSHSSGVTGQGRVPWHSATLMRTTGMSSGYTKAGSSMIATATDTLSQVIG
eukprot:4860687-Amphidinium_carterae.2